MEEQSPVVREEEVVSTAPAVPVTVKTPEVAVDSKTETFSANSQLPKEENPAEKQPKLQKPTESTDNVNLKETPSTSAATVANNNQTANEKGDNSGDEEVDDPELTRFETQLTADPYNGDM